MIQKKVRVMTTVMLGEEEWLRKKLYHSNDSTAVYVHIDMYIV